MDRRARVSLALCVFLPGCAAQREVDWSVENREDEAQVRRRLEEIFDAAEKKDLDRLDSYHLYGPKFTKFGESDWRFRQDAAAAREGEHQLAAIEGLSMEANDVEVDVFGDAAVATFMLEYGFKSGQETIRSRSRGTLVFVRDRDGWRIVHEHFSFPPPTPCR